MTSLVLRKCIQAIYTRNLIETLFTVMLLVEMGLNGITSKSV